MLRPGFGEPHPELAPLLKGRRPLATQRAAWGRGALPLEVHAYAGDAELPDVLVTSVRCIVRVGEQLVLCANEGGVHPWPGGRRESGESYLDTALREVHEETGWRLERASLRALGWLHLHHLGPCPPGHAYPYPDFLQLVFASQALHRDGGPSEDWTDRDGYEQSSTLVDVDEALERVDPIAAAFLRLLGSEAQR
jgi:ADP-ribose pyrophosphatase YjhB (NUDIX family)